MPLRLQAPRKTEAQLRAMAASGSSGVARRAQAELKRRVTEALAMGRSQ